MSRTLTYGDCVNYINKIYNITCIYSFELFDPNFKYCGLLKNSDTEKYTITFWYKIPNYTNVININVADIKRYINCNELLE